MFDADRAVEVISRPLLEGMRAGYGSGYYLGAGLAITCAHVLPEGGSYERRLRRIDGSALPFEVVWSNTDDDVALLAVTWPVPVPAAALGVLPRVTTEAQVQFVMYGWPRVRDDGTVRDPVQVAGPVMLAEVAGGKSGRVALRPHLSLPPIRDRDDWKGMSGAAVFCAGHVVGVQVTRLEKSDLLEGRLLPEWVLQCTDEKHGGRSAEQILVEAGIQIGVDVPLANAVAEQLPRIIQRGAPLRLGDSTRRDALWAVSGEDNRPVHASPELEQNEWRATRKLLDVNRGLLSKFACKLYEPADRLSDIGFLALQSWLPSSPVDISDIALQYDDAWAAPVLDGTEWETESVRPRRTPVSHYRTYTDAVFELAKPELFYNAFGWRLVEMSSWTDEKPFMRFSKSTYFANNDICEAVAHETAQMFYGSRDSLEYLRRVDFPIRRLIGDPFDFSRRPVVPAVSTLMIRNEPGNRRFWLHMRDANSVATGGGTLQVIPSGCFQPANAHMGHDSDDFDLWRNIMRECSEELFGNREHTGNMRINYTRHPFSMLEDMRSQGRFRTYCVGVGLDALTLFGEILTVAVIEPRAFDVLTAQVVLSTSEGKLVGEYGKTESRAEVTAKKALQGFRFTNSVIRDLVRHAPVSPGGAACLLLAWKHRSTLFSNDLG